MSKIIALWSHPRSMSTTMERVMRERGDLRCLHEPFMHDYYVNRLQDPGVREMPHFLPEPGHPANFSSIRDMILEAGETESVFFKDMSYYILPYLDENRDFFEQMANCFLIRSPEASIASYYKLDAQVSLEEIGIEAQWMHYNWLEQAGIQSYVIEAETVQADPPSAIKKWCAFLDLRFKENSLSWNRETPVEWKQVEVWHAATLETDSIRQRTFSTENQEHQRFARAVEKAPHLQDYLDHHLTFYNKLKSRVTGM